jgi:hypothetical protein
MRAVVDAAFLIDLSGSSLKSWRTPATFSLVRMDKSCYKLIVHIFCILVKLTKFALQHIVRKVMAIIYSLISTSLFIISLASSAHYIIGVAVRPNNPSATWVYQEMLSRAFLVAPDQHGWVHILLYSLCRLRWKNISYKA